MIEQTFTSSMPTRVNYVIVTDYYFYVKHVSNHWRLFVLEFIDIFGEFSEVKEHRRLFVKNQINIFVGKKVLFSCKKYTLKTWVALASTFPFLDRIAQQTTDNLMNQILPMHKCIHQVQQLDSISVVST